MIRTIPIRHLVTMQCTQCTNYAELAYVTDDQGKLAIFDARCGDHTLATEPAINADDRNAHLGAKGGA